MFINDKNFQVHHKKNNLFTFLYDFPKKINKLGRHEK